MHAIAIGAFVVFATYALNEKEAHNYLAKGKDYANKRGVRIFPCDSKEKAKELAKVLA